MGRVANRHGEIMQQKMLLIIDIDFMTDIYFFPSPLAYCCMHHKITLMVVKTKSMTLHFLGQKIREAQMPAEKRFKKKKERPRSEEKNSKAIYYIIYNKYRNMSKYEKTKFVFGITTTNTATADVERSGVACMVWTS